MKYIRAKAGFIRYADSKLIITAARIIQCMKESTVFINPTPSIRELEEAYEDFQQKVIAAVGRNREKSALKLESKKRLSDLFQELVFYVNVVSNGELSILYSSGFPVLAKKQNGRPPSTPTGTYMKDGRRSGEVAFGFKPVGRDMHYDYCFATDLDDKNRPIWGEISTRTNSFITYQAGFEPGRYIYLRVRAWNKHGYSRWTEPIMHLVR